MSYVGPFINLFGSFICLYFIFFLLTFQITPIQSANPSHDVKSATNTNGDGNFPKNNNSIAKTANQSTNNHDIQFSPTKDVVQYAEGGSQNPIASQAKGNMLNTIPILNHKNNTELKSSTEKITEQKTGDIKNITSNKANVNSSISAHSGTNASKIIPNITHIPKPTITIPWDEVAKPKITNNKNTKSPIHSVLIDNKLEDQIDTVNKPVYEKSSYSSHPEFVLPVVITILVLPMFGLLGFLAIRRGREAWKNRHYRRMDFLIDGMYND